MNKRASRRKQKKITGVRKNSKKDPALMKPNHSKLCPSNTWPFC